MITLNETGFFDRGWCAVEAAIMQTLKLSYKEHIWFEHVPGALGIAHSPGILKEFSHPVAENTTKLQATCTEDKPKIEFLLRQSKFLGNQSPK